MKKITVIMLMMVICLIPMLSLAEEAKVTGVTLSCSESNNITISWNKVQDADSYKVYRWNGEKKKYVRIAETRELSYVDSGRKQYKRYVYKVAAVKDGKTGEKSDKKAIRTRVIVNKVKNVEAKGTDWNKVSITWDKVKGATGYKVYRWNSDKDKYVCIGRTTKLRYTDSGLYPHSRYTYKVAAYKKYTSVKGKKVTKVGARSEKDRARTLKSVRGYTLGKPLKKMEVGSAYGWRGGAFHQGVDFLKPKGTRVYAATSGYVYRSRSNYGGLGNGIVIKNECGVTTWYGHLSKRLVSQGSYVKKGQLIGKVGSTGNAGSCNHLHFEVWVDGYHYNPMKFY